jgi:catechol 2,3-dioxygenase-like lactoylglutathione lyase family enzyme
MPAVAAIGMNAPNGKPARSKIGLIHHHMDYSTHDLDGMRRFFTETLGFSNVLSIPEHGYLTVFVTPTSSIGFMRPAGSAPEQWQPPGEPNFYFFVADVDRAYADLTSRGVAFDQPPSDMPWGHRLAILRDPEGRRVCLAHDLKKR